MTGKQPFVAPKPMRGEMLDRYFEGLAAAFVEWVNAPNPKAEPAEHVLRECDCNCGTECPQGRRGIEAKCRIWVKP